MLEVKKGMNNLSVATGLLIASLAQFSIVQLVYNWTGWRMPNWVANTIRVIGIVGTVYSILRRFFPIPWWVAAAITGVRVASK